MESTPPGSPSQHASPNCSQREHDDTQRLLRELHDAVTANQRSGRLQALTAVILSLATLMSTWCGYQAARWSAEQSTMQSVADTAERQAAENTLAGLQIRTQDGLIILEYWRAMRTGDERASTTLFAHMRPELQRAVEESISEGILENPSVPGPLQQESYVLQSETLASAQRHTAHTASSQAVVSGYRSNEYVLLTLMMASVLFVGGISTTFSRKSVRRTLGVIASLVFAVAITRMFLLPVLWPVSFGAPSGAMAD